MHVLYYNSYHSFCAVQFTKRKERFMTTDETAVEQVRKEKNYGMLMPREEAQVSMVYEHLGVAGAPSSYIHSIVPNPTFTVFIVLLLVLGVLSPV